MKSKTSKLVLVLSALLALSSCNNSGGGRTSGGGGGGGPRPPELLNLTSPGATADAFVAALSRIDGRNSYIELYEDQSLRSYEPGQDEWIVIDDGKYGEYKAVSLQYIRTIVYVDFVRNTDALAAEFRAIEGDDINIGEYNGDYYGDDYEVVDYDPNSDLFFGRNSGYAYDDQEETTDVNLMAAVQTQEKFFKKAVAVASEYSVNISTAMSLLSLGTKVQNMKAQGELSSDDMEVLSKDLQKLSGISLDQVLTDPADKVLEQAAANLGTSAMNLKERVLPELFGISL
jgi:hypothetical protein